MDDFKKDIENILKLEPNHISAYSLIIEPSTKLYMEAKNDFDSLKIPTDKINRDMYHELINILTSFRIYSL